MALAPSFLLQEALFMHQQGAVAEAAARYGEVLRAEPKNVDALCLLGMALIQQCRPDEATKPLRKAVRLVPDHPGALAALGIALRQLGQLDEALVPLTRAIAKDPDNIDAHMNRAGVLMELRRVGDAVDAYDQAVDVRPDCLPAWIERGLALEAAGCPADALASYDRAIAVHPDALEAHANRGNVLRELGRFQDALDSYDRALAIGADIPGLHFSRALALKALDRYADALAALDRALALGLFRDAPVARANAHWNRALVLDLLGRHDEALAESAECLRLAPDDNEIQYLVSVIELRNGRWREAWPRYERRLALKIGIPPDFTPPPCPLWQGEALGERTLLIACEHGRGDRIQFAGLAAHLARQGQRVALWTDADLVPLMRTIPGIRTVVASPQELDIDERWRWVRMMSLPGLLELTPETVPQVTPYLAAEPARVDHWRGRIGTAGFRIGIAWQGSPAQRPDRRRSIPLRAFAPIAAIPGVRLIALQTGFGTEQIADAPFPVEVLGHDFEAGPDAFLDAAAVMEAVNLVISVDSAAVHLAGALARPTFLALSTAADWRWLAERDDSPFYPTLWIFRQKRSDWDDVMSHMAEAVSLAVANAQGGP